MSGGMRMGQRQNNFNTNYNNKFNTNNRQGAMRNRFVNNNTKNGMGPGPGVKHMNNSNSNGNRDSVIRRNIEHMKMVAQKKRVAQEMYYSAGRSPMVRTASGPFIKQDTSGRVSVQQRLGNKSILRNNNSNTNLQQQQQQQQNYVPRRPNQPFVSGLRSDKMVRVQNVQKKKQRFQNMNGIKTISSTGKVVYLQHVRRPANYTVRVENDRKPNYKHHVAKDLNPQLQQEIKLIQNKNMRQIITAPPPVPVPVPPQIEPSFEQIDRLPIVATSRTLHERFSMM